MSDAFIDGIVDDLRAFAAELLDPVLGRESVRARGSIRGSLGALLRAVDEISNLLPKLFAEVDVLDAPHVEQFALASTPRGAIASRRPSDWTLGEKKNPLPLRWMRYDPREVKNPRAFAWLLHLLMSLEEAVGAARKRNEKYVQNAEITRGGTTYFGQVDADALRAHLRAIRDAEARLARGIAEIHRQSNARIYRSETPPAPYPRGASWIVLRRKAAQWLDPLIGLMADAAAVLTGDAETAERPYLYQRWCGVKLFEAMRAAGFEAIDDPVGPLFLGGWIRFQKAPTTVTLWIEPRITHRTVHASGLVCAHAGEASPDYLIVTPGPHGDDAFVLDPTMTIDDDLVRAKGKYLTALERPEPAFIAGCPVTEYAVRRSWAAAPVLASYCRLFDGEGKTGVVPLHPADRRQEALRAWLKDILRHAEAWSTVRRAVL